MELSIRSASSGAAGSTLPQGILKRERPSAFGTPTAAAAQRSPPPLRHPRFSGGEAPSDHDTAARALATPPQGPPAIVATPLLLPASSSPFDRRRLSRSDVAAAARAPLTLFADKGALAARATQERAGASVALSEAALRAASVSSRHRRSSVAAAAPLSGSHTVQCTSASPPACARSSGGGGGGSPGARRCSTSFGARHPDDSPRAVSSQDSAAGSFRRSSFVAATSQAVTDTQIKRAQQKRQNPGVVQFPRILYGSVSLGESPTAEQLTRLEYLGDPRFGAVFSPANLQRPRTVLEIRAEVRQRAQLMRYLRKQREGATHLVHLDEADREHLTAKERLLRTQEYGRLVSRYRQEILKSGTVHHLHKLEEKDDGGENDGRREEATGREKKSTSALWHDRHRVGDSPADHLRGLMHEPRHHSEVTSHVLERRLPALDFSFMDVASPQQLLTADPRTGRRHMSDAEREQLQEIRERRRQKRLAERQENKNSDNFGNESRTKIVVVKQGDTTYAYDEKGVGGRGAKRLSMMMQHDERMELLKLHAQESQSFEAKHLKLNNNKLTCIDREFVTVLRKILVTNIVTLDLSFNAITRIDEGVFGGTVAPAGDGEALHGLFGSFSGNKMFENEAVDRNAVARALMLSRKKALESEHNASTVLSSLTTLKLHGNALASPHEVFKLRPLHHQLQFLTLHGNPSIDDWLAVPGHKAQLLNAFPKLVSLNFSTLIPADGQP